jgi:hypothetical protein
VTPEGETEDADCDTELTSECAPLLTDTVTVCTEADEVGVDCTEDELIIVAKDVDSVDDVGVVEAIDEVSIGWEGIALSGDVGEALVEADGVDEPDAIDEYATLLDEEAPAGLVLEMVEVDAEVVPIIKVEVALVVAELALVVDEELIPVGEEGDDELAEDWVVASVVEVEEIVPTVDGEVEATVAVLIADDKFAAFEEEAAAVLVLAVEEAVLTAGDDVVVLEESEVVELVEVGDEVEVTEFVAVIVTVVGELVSLVVGAVEKVVVDPDPSSVMVIVEEVEVELGSGAPALMTTSLLCNTASSRLYLTFSGAARY